MVLDRGQLGQHYRIPDGGIAHLLVLLPNYTSHRFIAWRVYHQRLGSSSVVYRSVALSRHRSVALPTLLLYRLIALHRSVARLPWRCLAPYHTAVGIGACRAESGACRTETTEQRVESAEHRAEVRRHRAKRGATERKLRRNQGGNREADPEDTIWLFITSA